MNKKFASLGTALSRDEAKKIIGGLVEGGGAYCMVGASCSVYESSTGITHLGNCDADFGGGSGNTMGCGCHTQLGPYAPSSGTSRCVRGGLTEL